MRQSRARPKRQFRNKRQNHRSSDTSSHVSLIPRSLSDAATFVASVLPSRAACRNSRSRGVKGESGSCRRASTTMEMDEIRCVFVTTGPEHLPSTMEAKRFDPNGELSAGLLHLSANQMGPCLIRVTHTSFTKIRIGVRNSGNDSPPCWATQWSPLPDSCLPPAEEICCCRPRHSSVTRRPCTPSLPHRRLLGHPW
jgi:hypothetical protein